jgi:hypothetical protein
VSGDRMESVTQPGDVRIFAGDDVFAPFW